MKKTPQYLNRRNGIMATTITSLSEDKFAVVATILGGQRNTFHAMESMPISSPAETGTVAFTQNWSS